MKIAFFGSSLVSCYWNGAATYYRGLLKALARAGNEISFYEPDAFGRQQHRDIPDPDWARVIVYPAIPEGWQNALARAAADADVLVKASGVGVFDIELECALPDAASPRTTTIYWDVDAPATLEAMAHESEHHLHRAISRYDLVFTYGGGDPVVRRYTAAGARICVPIYNALDPDTHHPAPMRDDYHCDLSFLGNRLPDREARVEEFFLKPAALMPERVFVLGGAGWDDKSMPANVRYAGHVGTADHNAFFCSGSATLNVNRDCMARVGFSPPTRVFEAAGTGACLITDDWTGIELFLEPGREIFTARDGEGVAEYLATLTPETARRMGEAARRRVLSQHTYAHRARQVTQVLDSVVSRDVEAA